MRIPGDVVDCIELNGFFDDCVKTRVDRLNDIYRDVMKNVTVMRRAEKRKNYMEKRISVGNFVLSRNFSPYGKKKFVGPYKVIREVGNCAFVLKALSDGKNIVRHHNDLKVVTPVPTRRCSPSLETNVPQSQCQSSISSIVQNSIPGKRYPTRTRKSIDRYGVVPY